MLALSDSNSVQHRYCSHTGFESNTEFEWQYYHGLDHASKDSTGTGLDDIRVNVQTFSSISYRWPSQNHWSKQPLPPLVEGLLIIFVAVLTFAFQKLCAAIFATRKSDNLG